MNNKQLISELTRLFPQDQIYTDEISRLVKGTDAGLYRLLPNVVVRVNTEDEVIRLLKFCKAEKVGVTFKAGGTSLSGQTISDSILMEIGDGFDLSIITDKGLTATFGCSLTGTAANHLLKRYKRKLGPKPASINAAKIGGIIANNASGSSWGIRHNSYNTLKSMRIIFSDGSLLDTADSDSCLRFIADHPKLINEIQQLHTIAVNDSNIREKIATKFKLKNTCGYGVNALIDFNDPLEIIWHLMVGSEGTLGFVSQATFETVHDSPLKATAMIYFSNLRDVSNTILPLRQCKVSAAELMDRNALRAVEGQKGMPEELKTLPDDAAALLIDTSADDEETLFAQITEIENKLAHIATIGPIKFTTDKRMYNLYWNVRNGLFTSAAATRPPRTACIIEDIAFSAETLGDALTDVRTLLVKTGYENAVMWGHLLDGNVHFTVFPEINSSKEVEKYAIFMKELTELVAVKHKGSLKAEHGTGRNMAPFVEKEWGTEIYGLMQRIKEAFDPEKILNPGVLINNDPDVFIKNLKQIPDTNPLIDRCIECGFCEVNCPSKNLTFTPRQRIVAYRHLSQQRSTYKKNVFEKQIKQLSYSVKETCATDGKCSVACPVGIDTGKLVKELRYQHNGKAATMLADLIGKKMAGTTSLLRNLLPIPHIIGKIVGYNAMESVTKGLYRLSDGIVPLWTRYTPSGSKKITTNTYCVGIADAPTVVYFPTCITRSMGGPSFGYNETEDVPQKMLSILKKAGYNVIIPENKDKLCCGMAFNSKGFRNQAQKKERELNDALLKASRNGELPIVCDMSPCLLHMRDTLDKQLKLYDQVEFIHDFLLDRLRINKQPITVAIHNTCSTTKMHLEDKFLTIVSRCAQKVIIPNNISCCGWAGDRGFFYPELHKAALSPLKDGIKDAKEGYSNSRTCEIGLSINSGITYKSLVYLIDKVTF